MARKLSGNRYFHTALFTDVKEAQDALHDVEEAGISHQQLAFFVLHEDRDPAPERTPKPHGGDGLRGLLLGLGIGGFLGPTLSIVLAKLGVLSAVFEQTIVFGLFGGMLIGGLSAGLYGMGLKSTVPAQDAKSPAPAGNCLVTARAANRTILLQVEDIFRKHHALPAGL